MCDKNIGIVGLGLMGGAIAIALREKCGILQERLFASDINEEVLNKAKEQGLISHAYKTEDAGEMLKICDLVFLCLNPSSVICFLNEQFNYFKANSIVTDIAGTKTSISDAVQKLLKKEGVSGTVFDFIPGHPMAGAEKGGFENARLVDFTGKNYILTPTKNNKKENLEFLKNLIYKMGFSRITEVTPEEHDEKIAFTSQLCHIIASALIDCESDTSITRFGGGSFEDLTRIAMLNAPMWTEIFMENRDALLKRIIQFESSLGKIKDMIGKREAKELENTLALVRERRAKMNK